MTATQSDLLWTRAFVLLCIVQFLGYTQHFVLHPTIPIYVTQLGASPFVVGQVMASTAATTACYFGRWSATGPTAGAKAA